MGGTVQEWMSYVEEQGAKRRVRPDHDVLDDRAVFVQKGQTRADVLLLIFDVVYKNGGLPFVDYEYTRRLRDEHRFLRELGNERFEESQQARARAMFVELAAWYCGGDPVAFQSLIWDKAPKATNVGEAVTNFVKSRIQLVYDDLLKIVYHVKVFHEDN